MLVCLFLYGLFSITPVAKCVQIRLNKEVEKNLPLIIAKIYRFVLREFWNYSFKVWNSDYVQQDKLLLWAYLFQYVIFIYNSPGTLFLHCLTLSGILDPVICAALIHFYAGNTRLVLLNQEASQLLYPASLKTLCIKGTVWKTPIKH